MLGPTIDGLLQESTRPTSPILESIRAASITSFGPTESGESPLRLTLISDMIQHSDLLSHYRMNVHYIGVRRIVHEP